MHATEVEKGHVHMNSGGQVFQCFAETETQPRKAPKMCAQTQIRPFDMTRGDSCGVRVADDRSRDRRRNTRWRVPFWPFAVTGTVNLHELSKIDGSSEVFLNRGDVRLESICSDLEPSARAVVQVTDELVCACGNSLAHKVGQNHLGFGINRHPNVLIAPFGRIAGKQMAFFCV